MSGFYSKNVRELGSQVPDFLHVCMDFVPLIKGTEDLEILAVISLTWNQFHIQGAHAFY